MNLFYRGDFFVRIVHHQKTEEVSVCGQLEKAAVHLMAESSDRKSEAKGEERFFYHKYVYCRMLWSEFQFKLIILLSVQMSLFRVGFIYRVLEYVEGLKYILICSILLAPSILSSEVSYGRV